MHIKNDHHPFGGIKGRPNNVGVFTRDHGVHAHRRRLRIANKELSCKWPEMRRAGTAIECRGKIDESKSGLDLSVKCHCHSDNRIGAASEKLRAALLFAKDGAMIKLVVTGAAGRMGQAIVALSGKSSQFQVVGTTERGSDAAKIFALADVVIDFTTPEASLLHAKTAAQRGIPLVIGTTGFTDAQMQELRATTHNIAVVLSPNTSVGVNLFWHTAAQLAKICGAEYQLAIEETHHVHKKDAPSGTAKQLHALVAAAAGRDPRAISVASHRDGEVIGDHTITFDSEGDRITITHHAKTRTIFAHGALVAAEWVIRKSAGWYGMDDVLGLQ